MEFLPWVMTLKAQLLQAECGKKLPQQTCFKILILNALKSRWKLKLSSGFLLLLLLFQIITL